MELRRLRYSVAVGEEQHYGRAAQRLRVAEPALSRQIQDLEQEDNKSPLLASFVVDVQRSPDVRAVNKG